MKTVAKLLALVLLISVVAAIPARAVILTNISGPFVVSNAVNLVLLTTNNGSWIGTNYQDGAPGSTLYCRFSMGFQAVGLFAALEFYDNGNEVFGIAKNAGSSNWSYFYSPNGSGVGDLNPVLPIVANQWHTVVVKIVFNQGGAGNGTETIWMDPVWTNSAAGQSSSIITTPPAFDPAFNAVYLRCGNTPSSATFSNLVFATTGADIGFGSQSPAVALPDAAQVLTFHNDNLRSGVNTNETQLTLANVNTNSFGRLFSYPVDGYIYAEPLVVTNVAIPGQGLHNVVYVVTEHDSVYAFDADNSSGTNGLPLWQTSFLVNGETTVSSSVLGSTDIVPEVGVTSTPVIDPVTGTIYIEAKTKTSSGAYLHRLHALDITTGLERTNFNSPAVISATNYPGVGAGGSDTDGAGHVLWNPLRQHNRSALALLNGNIYIAYASHGDNTPYHGWLFAYNATNVAQQYGVFNTTPNGAQGGIWQAGGGPAIDAAGNIYLMTGNGSFNAAGASPTNNFAMSILKFSTAGGITLTDYFTMTNYSALSSGDEDLTSGAPLVLPDAAGSAAHPHLLVGAGKEGRIYLVDRDNLGGYNPGGDRVVQEFYGLVGGGQNGSFDTPVYFNNLLYYWATGDSLKAFTLTNGVINTTPAVASTTTGHYGPSPCLTANGTNNAIVWALQVDAFGSGGPAVLRAYNATNIAQELYDSSQLSPRDNGPGAIKFATPAIVNGRVYVGGQYALTVYGLGSWLPTPAISPGGGLFTNSITVTLSDPDANALLYYTLDGTTPTTNSALYSAPLVLTQSAMVEALAADGGSQSVVVSASYVNTLTAPPPPWLASDVGAVGAAGRAYYSNGAFTILGAGADIWNTADAFQYVYYQITNNCDISARLTSQSNTHPWAKAGVMIRETLGPSSTDAALLGTPANGFGMFYRNTTGASVAETVGPALNVPPNNWVRLTRTNNSFAGYESSNGTNWTLVGTTTIAMTNSGYYVGLAVCSHVAGTLCTAGFDNVTVNGRTAANPPPAVVMTAPANNSTYTASASVTLSANADSADGTIARVDFYSNTNTWLGTVTNAPYTLTVTGLGAGTYALSAVATDNFGLTNSSGTVSVTVNPGSGASYGATTRGPVPAFFNMPTAMPAQLPGTIPPLLSLTGVFSNTPSEIPVGGMIFYQPNASLWSDAAVKTRWMGVPYGGGAITPGQQIAFAPTGSWTFPAGTVFVKDFQLVTNQITGAKRRLETRLLVVDINGAVYGVTYKWRPDNSEADLLTNSLDEAIAITNTGGNWVQTWHYPSPAECLQCHTPAANYVLGASARQLNGNLTYPATGVTDNQIRTLNQLGMFNPAINESAIGGYEKLSALTNISASVQERARSFLDANCAFCHQPAGSGPTFDGRYETPLASQNITNVPAVKGNLGISDGAMIVRPGDIWRSVLYQRMNTTDSSVKMPPLARNLIDTNAVSVMAGWINSLPGMPALAPPTLTPDGGTYTNGVSVTLASSNAGASIYYTFDGSLPTTNSLVYSSPLMLTSNTLLTADAVENGYNTSVSSNANFTVASSSGVPSSLLLRLPFTNSVAGDGGNNLTLSDTSGGGVALTMNMLTNGTVAGNLHGAAGTGITNLNVAAMALDLTASTVPSQGNFQAGNNGGLGPIVSLNNSAALGTLGGSGVITNFTVTFWLKQNVAYGAAGGHAPRLWNLNTGKSVLDADAPAANGMGMAIQSSTQLYFNCNAHGSPLVTGVAPSVLVAGQWYFVAVTYDGTNYQMYLGTDRTNATLIGATALSGAVVNLAASGGVASLGIGNRSGDFARSFNGWVEDFRLYNSAGNSNFVDNVRQSVAGTAAQPPRALEVRPPRLLLNAASKLDGRFTLRFNGIDGQTYLVEMSTNLAEGSWTPVFTNRPNGGVFIYTDTNTTNDARFYRVRH